MSKSWSSTDLDETMRQHALWRDLVDISLNIEPVAEIGDKMDQVVQTVAKSFADQRELFLFQHLDKLVTYGLIEYPVIYNCANQALRGFFGTERQMILNQLIALVPKEKFRLGKRRFYHLMRWSSRTRR